MATSAATKPFDVVVFGATSFAGKLTAEYLLSTYGAAPPNFKWAIAGRSEEKLKALKASLADAVDPAASSLSTIVADSMDEEAIDRMVAQAKVVVTTVGPYELYGSKLVAACVRAGVHYCDLTGESLWVKEIIAKHHEEAERTGAKIVPSCGFDSIPADMGSFMMVEHMKRVHSANASDVRYIFDKGAGGPSGGTVASILLIVDKLWKGGSVVKSQLEDPLLLAPASGTPAPKVQTPGGFGYDSLAKRWTAPFVFASHDTKIVHRSACFLGYEQPFNYKEVMGFKGVLGGFAAAVATVTLGIGAFLLYLPPTRKMVAKFLPDPGQGPSKEERDNGFFWVDFFAKATVNHKEIITRGRVGSGKGDPGYKETAKMLAEGGLCLALDEDMDTEHKGGVLTTASALGMPFIDRMRKAGMTFDVMDT